jgi:CheY-like chemotaxis protein
MNRVLVNVMPGDWRCTEAVRASSGGQSLRIVSLNSAHLRAGDLRAAATGVSASVYKPIRPKLLLEALRRTFDRQQTLIRKASSDSIFDPQLGSRLRVGDPW